MSFTPRLEKAILFRAVRALPGVVALLALLALWQWFHNDSEGTWEKRLPGADTAGMEAALENVPAPFQGQLIRSDGVPADLPGAWPRFLGANFDGISTEEVRLAKKWGAGDPRTLWAIEVGEGYAGATVLKGRVYLLDYDAGSAKIGADALRCLSLADGREIWRYAYPVKIKRNHGMSRTVPAVTEQFVVALGPKCHVICLDSITGELRWKLDLVEEYGTRIPPWYAGQCPLIDGGKAIIAPGGDKVLMMAVDGATGEVLWETPNPRGWNMTHSSIIPMEFRGQRLYVYCASGGVVGVAAADGALLWETTEWKISIATISSPVIVGQGRIFLSGGYNAGSMMLQLREEAGEWAAEPLFRLKPEVFGATQQTPIFFEGHVYGVRPDGELVCLNPAGELVWTSGAAHRFGLGPYLIAGKLIYVMNDAGLLTLVEAKPTGYRQLAQSQVLSGHDAWGPMAMAGGRLIARDLTRMVCLDVSER